MTDAGSLFSQDQPMTFSSLLRGPELHQLLNILPDAILLTNSDGIITLLNQQAEVLFGYLQEELAGQPLECLLPERFRTAHVAHRIEYLHAPRTRPMGIGLQLFGRKKDGIEFPVDISLSPFRLDEQMYVIAAIRDVTEQRRRERERMQQMQQIQVQSELIHQSHDAILVRDPINRIVLWNRGAEETYGWTAQQATGRISHILLHTQFAPSRSTVEAQLQQEGMWEGELTHTCATGRQILVESRQVFIRDAQGQPQAILEINRDITRRRRREQDEHATHTHTQTRLSFLQHLLDALPSSVSLVAGTDARLLLTNRASETLWGARWPEGQSLEAFLSTQRIEVLGPDGKLLSLDQFATMRALCQQEEVRYHQETIRRADASRLSVLVNAIPLRLPMTGLDLLGHQPPEKGTPWSTEQPLALVLHQDVTPLKEAEDLKDEFIGIAAHELRTPLSVLTGYADMLLLQTARGRGPALAQWQQEALHEIRQATTRMVSLADELLDATRLQAGRLSLHQTPMDLGALLRRLVQRFQQASPHHQFTAHIPAEPLIAFLDPSRMEQVLCNVIENAIKYSPQGGSIIITLQTEAEQRAAISVQDHGIGIPLQQQAQIFGRFLRAENAQAWGIPGTGLGLYLCREVIALHQGQISFTSQEGEGSTFVIHMPLLEGGAASSLGESQGDEAAP